jgi:hypothetical protein
MRGNPMSTQIKIPYGTEPSKTATLLLAAAEETGDGQASVLSQGDGYFLVTQETAEAAGLSGEEVYEAPEPEVREPVFDFSQQKAEAERLEQIEATNSRNLREANASDSALTQRAEEIAEAERIVAAHEAGEPVDLGDDEPAEEPVDVGVQTEVVDETADDPYDPTAHSVAEVNEYLKGADEDEKARVVAAEQARTDRDPRTSIDGV